MDNRLAYRTKKEIAILLAQYLQIGNREGENKIRIGTHTYTVDCYEYGFSKDWPTPSKSIKWIQSEGLVPVFIQEFTKYSISYHNEIHIPHLEYWLWSEGYSPTLHTPTHLRWNNVPVPPVYNTIDELTLQELHSYIERGEDFAERGEKASTFRLKPADIKLFRALARRVFGRRVRAKFLEVCIPIW